MRRSRPMIALVAGALTLGLMAEAGAASIEFSPTIEFTLGDKKADANPSLKVVVKQDSGEEELASVELRVPAGFTLASDQQLTHGESLGQGTITIDTGPRCGGAPAGSAPANVPVTITERDRTSAQTASGVTAVYVVDLRITTIVLEVSGSTQQGWTLKGPIPSNAATCPPFTFDANFLARGAMSQAPIFLNPKNGGTYKFEAIFKGLSGSTANLEQNIQIEGPPAPQAGTGGDDQAKKKCKKIKNKKKRRKCLKKLK